ncbi:hypothetical protein [Corynebacterium bovis]|uniref:hypothetical protein n=1 Tax=Corynebacterium bovis TaxID=36808 RepID=UPI000F6522D1|nr:hypothetical protein [Corynebacterium bovis]
MTKKKTHSQTLIEREFANYLEELKTCEYKPSKDGGREWEMFIAQILMKPHGLSQEDVDSGIIGGEYDGGVDGMYVIR